MKDFISAIVKAILAAGLVLCLIAATAFAQTQPVTEVVYYTADGEQPALKRHNMRLLRLALEKTKSQYGPFELSERTSKDGQMGALKSLNGQNLAIPVMPTMTDKIREKVFIPVRVPLYKGLFGVRLVVIKSESEPRFARASELGILRQFGFGQGRDWPDAQILRDNNYMVRGYDDKESLFNGLSYGEFDFFPRSVAEVWEELDHHSDKNLKVLDGVYMYYPTAVYFFLGKNRESAELSKRIARGLQVAIEDGSFNRIFDETMGEFLEWADLASRKEIRLKNVLLPDNSPLEEARYWYINK